MIPERFWGQVYTYARWQEEMTRQGLMLREPLEVRWTKEAAASIAEDETHLRGLIQRHCL